MIAIGRQGSADGIFLKSLKKCCNLSTFADVRAIISLSFQIRGGLRNLENVISSLTLGNRLLGGHSSHVRACPIETNSHLMGQFLSPHEFRFCSLYSVRLLEDEGSNPITPQGDGNIFSA